MTACLTDMCVIDARARSGSQIQWKFWIICNQCMNCTWNRACDSVSYVYCVSGVRASDSETNDIALTKSVFNGRNGVLHIHRHVPCRRTNDVCARMEMTEISLRIIIFCTYCLHCQMFRFSFLVAARDQQKSRLETQRRIIVSAYRINFLLHFPLSLSPSHSIAYCRLHFTTIHVTSTSANKLSDPKRTL